MGENQISEYVIEFFDGCLTSLKGFPAIFHLDDQIERDETPPPEPKEQQKQKMTVLQARNRTMQSKRQTKKVTSEKEIPREKSSRLMFLKVSFFV